MIELIEGFPERVIAITAKGHVTAADYDNALIPMIEEALERHRRVSLYYEIGQEFSSADLGAAWKDFVVSIVYLPRWARLAIVTDIAWVRFVARSLRFLMFGHLKVFRTAESSKARSWIESAQPA